MVYNDKHKFCNHIAMKHNDQIPEEYEPLEFAYALLTHKPIEAHTCVICHKNHVEFNAQTLKYARLCDDPRCKDEYVRLMKSRMVNVYGKEHLLNEADMQRKMLYNHADAHDYVWDNTHRFRVIGTYEVDFLNFMKTHGWSPDDILAPSPNSYVYKWDDGTEHMYIPDFYIPSLSLEIEIKQGGFNDSFMQHNRGIEAEKDKRMIAESSRSGIHYIKILDKNYDEFMRDYVKSDTNSPE